MGLIVVRGRGEVKGQLVTKSVGRVGGGEAGVGGAQAG